MTERIRGAVFFDRAKKNENWPDARGDFIANEAFVDDIIAAFEKSENGEFEISFAGWTKEGPKAGKYLSAQLEVATKKPTKKKTKSTEDTDLDDEIPF